MLQRTGRFGRADRLLKTRDFRRIGREGHRRQTRHFVVLSVGGDPAAAQAARTRLGVTVSRRVGNAVARNRVKRRVREWFRHSRRGLRGVRELVVIARSGAAELEMAEITEDLDQLLGTRAGSEPR